MTWLSHTISRDPFSWHEKGLCLCLQVYCQNATGTDHTISIIGVETHWHILKKYEGALSFATDAWTFPNHKAYVAITIHFEHEGNSIAMLLDLVEIAKSHSSMNLVATFAEVLEEFGISDKVY